MTDEQLLKVFEDGLRDMSGDGIAYHPTDHDFLLSGLRAVYECALNKGDAQ
jgi:hypothetical protein